MKLILIRHATSIKNLENRHGDSTTELPLTLEGLKEAEQFAVTFSKLTQLDALYCSNSTSALHTTKVLCQAQRIQPRVDVALRSIHFGVISGLPRMDVHTKYPNIMSQIESYDHGNLHPKEFNIPESETSSEFEMRIRKVLHKIINSHQHIVCIVAHRSTITMILNIILSWPKSINEAKYHVFNLPPLSVSVAQVQVPSLGGNIQLVGRSIQDENVRAVLREKLEA